MGKDIYHLVFFHGVVSPQHCPFSLISFCILSLLSPPRFPSVAVLHLAKATNSFPSAANPRAAAHAHTKPSREPAGLPAAPVTEDVVELGGVVRVELGGTLRVGLAPPPPPLPLLVVVTGGGVADGGGSEGEGA